MEGLEALNTSPIRAKATASAAPGGELGVTAPFYVNSLPFRDVLPELADVPPIDGHRRRLRVG